MFMTTPLAIENRSMEIIAPYLKNLNLNNEEKKIYSRIIHASGDVEYASLIKIHSELIPIAKERIVHGTNIFTDVEMVKHGINNRTLKKFGGNVFCKIADKNVYEFAQREKITRSMAAMRIFGKQLNNEIIAIGNAPTALFEVLRLINEDNIHPSAIIGVPVGFVGAAEAKTQLIAQKKIPFITVEGSKGGSSIAVAIINAILYILDDLRD